MCCWAVSGEFLSQLSELLAWVTTFVVTQHHATAFSDCFFRLCSETVKGKQGKSSPDKSKGDQPIPLQCFAINRDGEDKHAAGANILEEAQCR